MDAEAVHPGYGFLSENPQFAKAVINAGLRWIGPSPEAIAIMGDKLAAKRLMAAAGVPTVPGTDGPISHYDELEAFAKKHDFPVMLKAAGGGGGRGMRAVYTMTDLKASFEACQREALAYFGSRDVFCEKLVKSGRHIEIQILADRYGNCISLFERDCSLQRRQQKIWEEAPSVYLTADNRDYLGDLACQAAKSCHYEGVGTVEFICGAQGQDEFYFMEMNTRIQVEHPATEVITGVDLIQEQIKVAFGAKIDLSTFPKTPKGYGIELRINAEDPESGFRPSPGQVTKVIWPRGPGVRVDSHIESGAFVPGEYDSLIGKIIVWAETREKALVRLERALGQTIIEGEIRTNIDFHRALLRDHRVQQGDFHTQFIEQNMEVLLSGIQEGGSFGPEFDKYLIAAAFLYQQRSNTQSISPSIAPSKPDSLWKSSSWKTSVGLKT